jgi:hypothetical protein
LKTHIAEIYKTGENPLDCQSHPDSSSPSYRLEESELRLQTSSRNKVVAQALPQLIQSQQNVHKRLIITLKLMETNSRIYQMLKNKK